MASKRSDVSKKMSMFEKNDGLYNWIITIIGDVVTIRVPAFSWWADKKNYISPNATTVAF